MHLSGGWRAARRRSEALVGRHSKQQLRPPSGIRECNEIETKVLLLYFPCLCLCIEQAKFVSNTSNFQSLRFDLSYLTTRIWSPNSTHCLVFAGNFRGDFHGRLRGAYFGRQIARACSCGPLLKRRAKGQNWFGAGASRQMPRGRSVRSLTGGPIRTRCWIREKRSAHISRSSQVPCYAPSISCVCLIFF